MRTINSIKELREIIQSINRMNELVGFVPTMGALHDGHLKLISESLSDNSITIVSIFINPLQFNNQSDLEKYPRTIEKDISLLEELDIDFVFIPDDSEFYPSPPSITIGFGKLAETSTFRII